MFVHLVLNKVNQLEYEKLPMLRRLQSEIYIEKLPNMSNRK